MLQIEFLIAAERCDCMTFEEAYEEAKAYFKRDGIIDIACALDADTHWIFYPGKADKMEVGSEGIKIEKQTGQLDEFFLPDDENFELLDKSVKIDIGG